MDPAKVVAEIAKPISNQSCGLYLMMISISPVSLIQAVYGWIGVYLLLWTTITGILASKIKCSVKMKEKIKHLGGYACTYIWKINVTKHK